MDKTEKIICAENLLKDAFGLIYAQHELMSKMACKMAKLQNTLNNIESMIRTIKDEEVSTLISK